MQFGNTVRLSVAGLLLLGGGFGSGLLVGRQFPAHRYEKYGQTLYMLETTTGRMCDPFKDSNGWALLEN